MSDEMILLYLHHLTMAAIGTKHWSAAYEKWRDFGERIGHERYENALKWMRTFNAQYAKKVEIPLDNY